VKPRELIERWPVLRQLAEDDPTGRGKAVQSAKTEQLRPRTDGAQHVVQSICPYCAVGCGQLVYVRDGKVDQIEGDPDSPISRGRLCPKGAASKNLVTSPSREYKAKYRRPNGTEWEELELEEALEMIADRVVETRKATWQKQGDAGAATQRTMAIAMLGGATLDNEENYLIKKLAMGLGVVQVENQARI
jgi:formate dehydrogenase major subunit